MRAPRRSIWLVVTLGASASILCAGCNDESPAAPPTVTVTAPSPGHENEGGHSGGGGGGGGGGGATTTHHTTTAPPTSGHYDPSNCPPGRLC